jgi:hypothetical protein
MTEPPMNADKNIDFLSAFIGVHRRFHCYFPDKAAGAGVSAPGGGQAQKPQVEVQFEKTAPDAHRGHRTKGGVPMAALTRSGSFVETSPASAEIQ